MARFSVQATSHSFQLKEISEKEVREQLLTVKANKAIGLDNISARLLKCGALEITPSITKILNSFRKVSRDLEMCQSCSSFQVRRPYKCNKLSSHLDTAHSQ